MAALMYALLITFCYVVLHTLKCQFIICFNVLPNFMFQHIPCNPSHIFSKSVLSFQCPAVGLCTIEMCVMGSYSAAGRYPADINIEWTSVKSTVRTIQIVKASQCIIIILTSVNFMMPAQL